MSTHSVFTPNRENKTKSVDNTNHRRDNSPMPANKAAQGERIGGHHGNGSFKTEGDVMALVEGKEKSLRL